MSNNLKVSVLMTSYNASLFIEKSIKSIIKQSYKNWELIIVDDLSTDQTIKIIKKFKNKKIKLFPLKKHIGRTKALNYGLKKTRGNLIAVLDADDLAHKQRLKIQVNFLLKNQNALLVGTWYKVINKKGKFVESVKANVLKEKIFEKMLVKNIFCHSSVMFRKKILKRIGKYPNNIIYSQDHAFILKSMKLEIPRMIPMYLTQSRRWNKSMTFNPIYKKTIIIEKIKLMLYSAKNFKFTIKSSILWPIVFVKALVDFILIKLFLPIK